MPAEDAAQFLADFTAYATLHKLNGNDEDSKARKIAAFQLHLTGPCLVWFNNLSTTDRSTWANIETAFNSKYVNIDIENNPALHAESELLSKMKLAPNQSIDEFHAMLLQKGKRLKKPERDILIRFIDGLPAQLAFFVRAGRPADLESALSSAKLGESFGYRYQPETNLIAGSFAAVNNFESKPNQLTGLTSQVAAITKRLDDVEMSSCQQQRGGFRGGFQPGYHRDRGRGRGKIGRAHV